MRRVATLALALSLLGCGSAVDPFAGVYDRVELATWSADGFSLDANGDPVVACVLIGAKGRLVVDPSFGTALMRGDDVHPVSWPPGFTGRRVRSEVQVLDRDRNAVAMTGGSYEVFYSKVGFGAFPGQVLEACGVVTPHGDPFLLQQAKEALDERLRQTPAR